MGKYTYFIKGSVNSIQKYNENLELCKGIRTDIEKVRKNFEEAVEADKTSFLNQARQHPLYMPEDEPDLLEKWSTYEKGVRDQFEAQIAPVERRISQKETSSYIGIILAIIGGISMVLIMYAVSHGGL